MIDPFDSNRSIHPSIRPISLLEWSIPKKGEGKAREKFLPSGPMID